MSSKELVTHICIHCGHLQKIETGVNKGNINTLADPYTPRICNTCDKPGQYPIVIGNTRVAIFGLVRRIQSLEKTLGDLVEKLNGPDDKAST